MTDVEEEDAGTSSSASGLETTVQIDSQRQSRNIAEKKRREDLNLLMEDMKARVPPIACSSQKTDKNSSLRKIAGYLRANRVYGGTYGFLSKKYANFDLETYLVDYVFGKGGFGIALTSTGKIMHVTSQVKECFGYSPDDLINMSFYEFVHPDDHEELRRNINFDDPPQTAKITELPSDSSNSSEDSTSARGQGFKKQRRTFIIRMAEFAGSKQDNVQYEFVVINGVLNCKSRKLDPREIVAANNYVVFHGLAYLPKKRPITELSMMDANKDEYITRHLLDSRILYCDPRVSTVTGYLLEEVSGQSAFKFMHNDDYRWTIIGLRQMYDQYEPCGTSCYRLKSKTGEYIYLSTHAYLEQDSNSQTIASFVCINTRVSEEEGIRLMKQMKDRFSANLTEAARAIIQNGDETAHSVESNVQRSNYASSTDVQARVEDAITCLFRDLKSLNKKINAPGEKQLNMLSLKGNDSKPSTPQPTGHSPPSVSPPIQHDANVPHSSHVYRPLEELSPTPGYYENNVTEPIVASPQSCDSNSQYSMKRVSDDDSEDPKFRKRPKGDVIPPNNDEALLNPTPESDSDLKVVLQQMMVNSQAVSDQLRRTHIAVADSQQNLDTELYQLARDWKTLPFAVQRGIVTDCMTEQSNQKQMLTSLQQAHQNWQVNMNYNLGI